MFSDDALRRVLMDLEYGIPTLRLDVLLDDRPDLVRQRSTMGYPLHDACRGGLPLSVVQHIVERFPEALTASASDVWHQTPLFAACSRSDPQMDTIAYLVKADFPGCLMGTAERPPLLHFCMSVWNQPLKVWTQLVDWVLTRYSEALFFADFNGRYVVHHATSSSDTKRFRTLLQTFLPDKLVDAHGNHVLHLAVADSHRVPQNLTCILEECPQALCLSNHEGALPVHLAIKKHDRNLLLERYPFAMLHTTHLGETVLGNVRRELGRCIRVYYPEVGEIVDGDDDGNEDDVTNDAGTESSLVLRREDDEWEFPCVRWIFPTNPSFLGELDRLIDILGTQVLPPLRIILVESCRLRTGQGLPPEVLNEIFLLAVPHYEEALTHTNYHETWTSSER